MYLTILTLHSWVRWAALVSGLVVTIVAIADRSGDREGTAERWGLLLMMAADLQLVLGLLLYFVVSPNMEMLRAHFAEAMRTPSLRFWAVEHVGTMLAAIVLVHVGRVLVRRATTAAARRSRRMLWFGIATALMVLATPWAGFANGRPLFRL